MSLREHRSSPSTVQFTYSLQPCPPTSLPTVSTVVDVITSLLQSLLCLLLVQWSTIHFNTNRIFGPVLRYLRLLLPYNDIRIVHLTHKTWEFTPLGLISILFLAVFLFFSKSTPIGILFNIQAHSRWIILNYPLVRCTDYDTYAISISKSVAIYSSLTNRRCITVWRIQGDGGTILSCCCRPWRGESRGCVSCIIPFLIVS